MEFSIIVPSLNEEPYIGACLESISKQTIPRNNYEIIVSDGGSNDNTVKIAGKYADRVIVSEKKGIWWGRNQGAEFAKGKYLVFIDADTRIKKDYLETVHRYLESGVVGLTTAFELDGADFKIKFYECICNCYFGLKSKIDNVTLIGFNLCVPRDVFMNIGGFKDYALEDVFLSYELRKEGRTCFLIQRKVVTSPRRLDAYGAIGLCRYYFELGMIDSGRISNLYMSKYLKYTNYVPIRNPHQRARDNLENFKALSEFLCSIQRYVCK